MILHWMLRVPVHGSPHDNHSYQYTRYTRHMRRQDVDSPTVFGPPTAPYVPAMALVAVAPQQPPHFAGLDGTLVGDPHPQPEPGTPLDQAMEESGAHTDTLSWLSPLSSAGDEVPGSRAAEGPHPSAEGLEAQTTRAVPEGGTTYRRPRRSYSRSRSPRRNRRLRRSRSHRRSGPPTIGEQREF
jgi:hypothetical protein